MIKQYWIYLLMIMLGFSHSTIAQELTSNNYGISSPLQTKTIYDIHIAQDGLLFIATDNGFWSYDGLQFQSYQKQGLKTQGVTNIQEDKDGTIYFQNFKGDVFYIHQKHPVVDSCAQNLPFKVQSFQVVGDYVYYYNDNQLAFRNNKSSNATILPPPNSENSWRIKQSGHHGIVHRIASTNPQDNNTQLCQLTPNGLVDLGLSSKTNIALLPEYDKKACIYQPDPEHNGHILGVNQQLIADLSLYEQKLTPIKIKRINQRPWVACTNGLYLPHLNKLFFKDCFISDIAQDQEGNIWVATLYKGLFKIVDEYHQFYPNPDDNSRTDFILKHENNLIFSNLVGRVFHWSNEQEKALKISSSSQQDQIKNIVYSNRMGLYIQSGNYQKYFNREFRTTKEFISYGSFYLNSDSSWFKIRGQQSLDFSKLDALYSNQFSPKYSKQYPLFQVTFIEAFPNQIYSLEFANQVTAIHKWHQWILAIASDSLNFIHDVHFDSIRSYPIPSKSQKIYILNDRLWIEFSNQLIEYDSLGNERHTIARVNGLEQNITNISINNQYIAISTKAAIYLYNVQTMEYVHKFTAQNGIASIDFVKGWIYGNMLYVNGSKGVSKIPIKNQYPKGAPLIRLEKILIKKEESKDTALAYDENDIQIHFKVHSFTTQGSLFWRLNNKEWKALDGKPIISLEELQYGNYTIEAYFENDLGAQSSVLTYQFTIHKPYWLQQWFLGLALLLLLGFVWGIYRIRLQQVNIRNTLKNDLIASQMTALKSQMNPHFTFNALNSIQSLILFEKNKEAYKYINKFAALLRQTLNYSDKDYIPLEREIELLKNYLDMEKMRLDGELDYSINNIDHNNVQIPTMIIQPFVENALKHGLLHKQEGNKKVEIHFTIKEDLLLCSIIDNGIGRAKAQEIKLQQKHVQPSFSTGATQKRLDLLQQLEHTKLGVRYTDLKDQDNNPLGTKVEITIPIYD